MDGRNSCGIPQSKVGTCCIYFTPPSCPKGVSRKCSGSHVAISYSCITYQSRLQPEKAITEFKPFAFVHSHSSLMKSLGNCHYHPCQKEKKKKANPPICVSAPGQCVQPQRKRRCSFDDMSEGDLRGTAAWLSAEIIPYTSSSSRLVLRSLWLWAYKELLIKMTARTDKKDMIRKQDRFSKSRSSLNVGCLNGSACEVL